MKKKSLGINAGLNMIRTTLSVVFPLITFPYISRVLSVDSVGKYNFAYSIINFFQLIAGLGINIYAIREGSKLRDSRMRLSAFASEVYTINILSTLASYIVLGICIAFVPQFRGYEGILGILSLIIISVTLGCEWIYSIYEEYLYITIRSIVVYFLSFLLLFIMVKDAKDLLNYAIVVAIANGGGNLLYIFRRKKYCDIKFLFNFSNVHFSKHIKPIFMIFCNTVTTSIYINSGTMLLGFLSTEYSVGLYSLATKIYAIVKQMLAAVITVSIPRLSNLWGMGKRREFNETANSIFTSLLTFVMPAVVGLIGLNTDVIQMISNEKYIPAKYTLLILCIALIFSTFNWFFTSCILIPIREEEKVLRVTSVSAILNVLINLVFIPVLLHNGAALATLVAEGIGLVLSLYYTKKSYKIQVAKKDIMSVLLGCLSIILICLLMRRIASILIFRVGLSLVFSILAYGGILYVLKNSTVVSIKKFLIELKNKDKK